MEKEKSIVEDLHGNVFERDIQKFEVVKSDPFNCPKVIDENEERILTKDIITNRTFILIRYKGKYGYIFNANGLYIYGIFKHIGYKPKNDIRSNEKF